MLSSKGQTKGRLSTVYLAILCAIVLGILIFNGLLEINRTRRGFYLLLERETTLLLEQFERNIQETFELLRLLERNPETRLLSASFSSFLFALEESVAEYLVETAHRVEQSDGQKSLGTPELRSLCDQYLLSSIEIYDSRGDLLKAWPVPSPASKRKGFLRDLVEGRRTVVIDLFGKSLDPETERFSVAISRRTVPGIVVCEINREQLRKLFNQLAIQRAISDIGLREGILYVSVVDSQLSTVAHSDPTLIGRREEDPFLTKSLQSGSFSRLYHRDKGEEVFEMAKPLALYGGSKGLIRLGYSPREIYPVLDQIRRGVALSVLFFLIFGVLAVTLIWVNQNRHVKKVKEMEDRIQLAERLSSLGHLAAGVAHEIRNPLNAISLGLQSLKKEFSLEGEASRSASLSLMEVIHKEIRRVNEIVEQFLSLARPVPVDLRESSLQELLGSLITLFREEASSHGIKVEEEIPSELPKIEMDEARLRQAFVNLMKNAIQAMEQGGLLRIGARSYRDRVEVTLTDSGPGISADEMEKIFHYYYTTKERGVGLGLPIAHRIIEAHGGRLKMESQVGVGTKVTVTLPRGSRG